MHPNSMKRTKIFSLGSNGLDRVRSMQKIPTRLRGTNFYTSSARFAPNSVRQPNDPKCAQIKRNVPKHQFRFQWGGSGAFVAKNSDATSLHEFCTSLACFVPSFVRQPNGPKCTQVVWNVSLVSNGVDRVCSLQKILTRLHGTNFCIVRPILHRVS